MMSMRTVLLVVLMAGCPQPTAVAPIATTNDGMCDEHRIVEALCTKHHPSLAAVFQAKGDWCSEHGFAESLCPDCHPERGGRPAADVAAKLAVEDGAPADRTLVKLNSAMDARTVGLQTVAAVAQDQATTLEVNARLVYDAAKVAIINATAPGVVRQLRVDVGTVVKRGQLLAIIDSTHVGASRSGLQGARARLLAAEAAVLRTTELVAAGIASKRQLQEAEQLRDAAQADVAAGQSSVAVVGGGDDGQYSITSPMAGVVVQRQVSVGQHVGPEPLFEVVDRSSMWAELAIPERNVAVVAEGQRVDIRFDALPEHSFIGDIRYIAPSVDSNSRTVLARVSLTNVDGQLRAHMVGRARIAITSSTPRVVVPIAAVQRAGTAQLVFVQTGVGRYEARRVSTAPPRDGMIELSGGVAVGEVVVTEGSFLLKTETLKGAIGAGCCD